MLNLKQLSKESIPSALVKAKHYRLLNEPWQAESICRDILEVEPDNQKAILYLILAITDQFSARKSAHSNEAKKMCKLLSEEYQQNYYRGIIEERLGKAATRRNIPRAKYIAYEFYRNAMSYYEAAEKIQPENNQDAILRWNACIRAIDEFGLCAAPEDDRTVAFLDV